MTARHSTPSGRARKGQPTKPKKPHPDFPLTPHASGQWCKKVLGKIQYFGAWGDPQAALNRWLAEKDYLLAGKLPPAPGPFTVRELVNENMNAQDAKLRTGRIKPDTWREYEQVCEELVRAFGAARDVGNLGPKDFGALATSWAQRWSRARLGKFIVMARTVFTLQKPMT